jgi:outer membrane protein OmpA-like peptidoglycan-associated protein
MLALNRRPGAPRRVVARLLATTLLGAAIAAVPLVVPDITPSAVAAVGGPVVLDGMDPVCHATMGEPTGGYIRAVLAGLHTNATRTNDGSIAVVGVDASTSSCGGTFGGFMGSFTSAITPAPTVRYYPDSNAITGLFDAIEVGTATPAVVWIPDGAYAGAAALSARAQDLADFVGSGGGLFSNYSEYGWLPVLIPGAQFNEGGCNGGPAVTATGKASFPSLTDELVTACWHGFFTGDIGALTVLVDWPYPRPTDDRVGVAIGGVQVTLAPAPVVTAPGAPSISGTLAADGKVSVTVEAPESDGGAPVTSYVLTAQPGGKQVTLLGAAGGVAVFTGLTNGVDYTFTATATNQVGASDPSDPAMATPVKAVTAPGAPTITKTVVADRKISVTVTVPANDGGGAITSVTVTARPGGKQVTLLGAAGGVAVFTGLTNGVNYTFTATAKNAAGGSPTSTPARAVPVTVPSDPSWKVTKVGLDSISVAVNAPTHNGGSTLRRMSVTVTGSGVNKTVDIPVRGGTAIVKGLKPGTSYKVSVVAQSAAGASKSMSRTVRTSPIPKRPVPMVKAPATLYPGMSATLTADGLFAYQSAKLTKAGRAQARQIVKALGAAKKIRCEGHTDGADTKVNVRLGLARAKAVCSYLASRGVDAKTSTVSYGGKRPVRRTGTRDQRSVNRRVDVTVVR